MPLYRDSFGHQHKATWQTLKQMVRDGQLQADQPVLPDDGDKAVWTTAGKTQQLRELWTEHRSVAPVTLQDEGLQTRQCRNCGGQLDSVTAGHVTCAFCGTVFEIAPPPVVKRPDAAASRSAVVVTRSGDLYDPYGHEAIVEQESRRNEGLAWAFGTLLLCAVLAFVMISWDKEKKSERTAAREMAVYDKEAEIEAAENALKAKMAQSEALLRSAKAKAQGTDSPIPPEQLGRALAEGDHIQVNFARGLKELDALEAFTDVELIAKHWNEYAKLGGIELKVPAWNGKVDCSLGGGGGVRYAFWARNGDDVDRITIDVTEGVCTVSHAGVMPRSANPTSPWLVRSLEKQLVPLRHVRDRGHLGYERAKLASHKGRWIWEFIGADDPRRFSPGLDWAMDAETGRQVPVPAAEQDK